jgi:hypothetical protein
MLTKTTKALATALALAGASIAMSVDSLAAPHGNGSYQDNGRYQNQDSYMRDRHNPTDTNGF